MFLKKEYNKWYYSLFREEQKARVRKWREKHKEITPEPKQKKKELPKIIIQRGEFKLHFN